jgi:hypothetical protein
MRLQSLLFQGRNPEGLWDADTLEMTSKLHRHRRLSCRQAHLAWRGPPLSRICS